MESTKEMPLILVVEDDEGDEQLTLRGLRTAPPTRIEVARDGGHAVEMLSEWDQKGTGPDLVLLDLKLPKLNGFEVLKWIRKQARFSRTPVVVFSSSDLTQDREAATHLGAQAYHTKPLDFSEYVAVVRKVVEQTLFNKGAA